MSKVTKIWLVAAASLILIGCILFGGVMIMPEGDFIKLATNKYETNNHTLSETFDSISVDTDTADIKFVPNEEGECSVVCYEQENAKHSVTVADGGLSVKSNTRDVKITVNH